MAMIGQERNDRGRDLSDAREEGARSPQNAGNEAAALAAGVIQLAQAGAVTVPMPGTLETVVVPIRPDTVYDLPEGTEGAQAREADGNLLLAFPNGGMVEFSGFASASNSVLFHTPDKGTLDADSLLHDLQSRGESQPAAIDSPHFSPGPSPEILAALLPTGPLSPTEVRFAEPAVIFHPGALGENSLLVTVIHDNGAVGASSGALGLRDQSNDRNTDPSLAPAAHFPPTQIIDSGPPIPLPGDSDGDSFKLKIASLPFDDSTPGVDVARFVPFVGDSETKQPIHVGDVLTLDQLQNRLFYRAVENHGVSAPIGEMVYSPTDNHQHTVQSVINFHFLG